MSGEFISASPVSVEQEGHYAQAEHEQQNNVEVQTALPNYLTLATVLWKGKDFAGIALETGYAGLQYHPVRPEFPLPFNRHLDIPVLYGVPVASMDAELQAAIRSGHQGFREQHHLYEVFSSRNAVVAGQAFIMMPERMASLDDLTELQNKLGRPLSLVTYPTKDNAEIHKTDGLFTERVFQPIADVLTIWDIETEGKSDDQVLTELIRQYKQRGYEGMCFDTFHWRRQGEIAGNSMPRWEAVLPRLIAEGHIKEIHVAVGRIDFPEQGIDTVGELKALLNGTHNTPITQMLELFQQAQWQGRAVVEVPASALSLVRTKTTEGLTNYQALMQDHERIVNTVSGLLQ